MARVAETPVSVVGAQRLVTMEPLKKFTVVNN